MKKSKSYVAYSNRFHKGPILEPFCSYFIICDLFYNLKLLYQLSLLTTQFCSIRIKNSLNEKLRRIVSIEQQSITMIYKGKEPYIFPKI